MPCRASVRALLAVPLVALPARSVMPRLPKAADLFVATRASRSLAVLPAAARGATHWLGILPPNQGVRVGVVLAPARPDALESFAKATATPGSRLYHRFLTAQALEARFGPPPRAVATDRAELKRLGFRYLGRQGFVLYASAPASVVDHVLRATLRIGRYHGMTLVAPDGVLHVPTALADVEWITGLVQPRGATAPPLPSRASLSARPASDRGKGTEGKPLAATLVGGYTASSAVVGPSAVPTGLPVTIRTAIDTPQGAGDETARMGDYAVDTGPGGQYLGGVEVDGPDASGDIATTFTAYAPGTYALSATVRVGPGLPPQIVALPAVTFTGSSALEGPVDAAQLNVALGAAQLVAAAPKTPASIAVFSTTAPDMSDLAAFAQQNGIAPLRPRVVPVDGGASPGANDEGELSLDLESLDTASPGAVVYVYTTPQTYTSKDTFLDVMNAAAANDNVSVLTFSYAQAEVPGGDETALEQAVAALNAEGITVVAGAGDNGAFGTGASAKRSVVSPADTPAVTAVGGVDMRESTGGGAPATAYWGSEIYAALDPAYLASLMERGGENGNVLGGGGYSQVFTAPSWQASAVAGAPGAGSGGRGVPDIAMPASPEYPGLAMILQGQPSIGGGTSMAAPLFAGYLADIAAQDGMRFGDVNPDLYQAAATDPSLMMQPVDGYDGEWTVAPGQWNPMTGLGTPNIGRLAQDLLTLSAPVVQTLSATPAHAKTVLPGQVVTAVFTATSGGGELAEGVPLTFSVTGTLPASGLGAHSVVTNDLGEATVTFADPSGPASGTIVAQAPSGVRAHTGELTVAAPKLVSMAFAARSAIAIAGQTTDLVVRDTTQPPGAVIGRVPVRVGVTGPRTLTLTTVLGAAGTVGVRLVRAGAYRVSIASVADPRLRARMTLDILPGEAVRYVLKQPPSAEPGRVFASHLAAYDAFGNLDTLVDGAVTLVWRVAGRTYRGRCTFRAGVATASFVPAANVSGRVRTAYTVHSPINA